MASASTKRNRVLLGVAVGALVLVVAFAWIGAAISPSSDTGSGQRPVPSAGVPATAVPTLAPSVIPASCAKIYSKDWTTEMNGAVLNPAWANSAGLSGTNVDAARPILTANARLNCVWGSSSGQGTNYLVTTLAAVTSAPASTAQAALQAAGYNCAPQDGGIRCAFISTNSAGNWGETGFFKDNVWISTFWQNLGPDGYTTDIVNTLWP